MTTDNSTNSKILELLTELNKRSGVMISILLRSMPEGKSSTTLIDQVRLLDNLSLRPRDIAEILGRTQAHINKELVGIRKTKVKETIKK